MGKGYTPLEEFFQDLLTLDICPKAVLQETVKLMAVAAVTVTVIMPLGAALLGTGLAVKFWFGRDHI